MNISIQKATLADLAIIQNISIETYNQHFPYLWEDAGEWYTSWKFTTEKLQKEIADSNEPFYLAKVGEEVMGYLKLQLNAPFPDEPTRNALLLDRVYVLDQAMGKGVGKALVNYAVQVAQDLNKELIWLVCMDSSSQPIKVYERHGFTKNSSFQLDYPHVKDEFRGMFRMKKEIKESL